MTNREWLKENADGPWISSFFFAPITLVLACLVPPIALFVYVMNMLVRTAALIFMFFPKLLIGTNLVDALDCLIPFAPKGSDGKNLVESFLDKEVNDD